MSQGEKMLGSRHTSTDRRDFVAGLAAAAVACGAPRWSSAQQVASAKLFVTSGKLRHQSQPVALFSTLAQTTNGDVVTLDAGARYQTVLGFGSALTDASCYLLQQMEPGLRQKFLRETYSPDAMNLNFGRVAIGSSDYSRTVFNYDDTPNDTALSHFSIAHDEDYILPILRAIRKFNPDLFLLATPWSPPGWMKTYGSMLGGWMSREFLQPYAQYFSKFLEAYAKAGIRIDAVTSQNELETDQNGSMPATYWTPEMEEEFIRDHLGPLLRKEHKGTQIWLLDHNYNLWKRVAWQLRDQKLRPFVDGVAWHGYVGTPDMMARLHESDPDIPFYWTEGGPDVTDVNYATDWTRWGRTFTEAMRNWCRGLITWNLVLDQDGNPNIGPFRCGGLVTVKPGGTLVESGQYWSLRHFSQHVKRGAVRIASHSDASELQHIGFRNPDGSRVLVVTNTGAPRTLEVAADGRSTRVLLPEDCVATLVW